MNTYGRGKAPAARVAHPVQNRGSKGMKHGYGYTDAYVWREKEARPLSYPKSYTNNPHLSEANRPFDDEDFDDEYDSSDDWDDEDPPYGFGVISNGGYKVPPIRDTPSVGQGVQGVQGKGGTGIKKTSEQHKPVDDDSWIVKGQMSGGPYDATVIPSFGGHVAKQIWEGKPRGVLKCYNLTSACNALVGWKESVSPGLKALKAA